MGSVHRQTAEQYVRVVLRPGDSAAIGLQFGYQQTRWDANDLLVPNSTQAPR
jgi:hypothetical protein